MPNKNAYKLTPKCFCCVYIIRTPEAPTKTTTLLRMTFGPHRTRVVRTCSSERDLSACVEIRSRTGEVFNRTEGGYCPQIN